LSNLLTQYSTKAKCHKLYPATTKDHQTGPHILKETPMREPSSQGETRQADMAVKMTEGRIATTENLQHQVADNPTV
jgi:hypothetical protein